MPQRLSQLGLLTLALALSAATAAADVIYLRTGKIYEGKATRDGDHVHITLDDGKKLTVPAKQVVHIEKGSGLVVPTTEPAGGRDDGFGDPQPLAPETLTQPESFVFLYMRNLAATPAGSGHDLREMLTRWRSAAHDRKRKVGLHWLEPDDFIRRRQVFEKLHDEAKDLFRKARRRGTSAADRAAQRRYRQAALAKLRTAAQSWTDPLLRFFLMAVAELEAHDYAQAEAFFRKCAADAPLVAAFHQGRAMALLGLKRPLDALAAFCEALRLKPDSRDALRLVRETMAEVPGSETSRPAYTAAQELLKKHAGSDRRSSSRTSTTWLLPGKDLRVRQQMLPAPDYDRFVFRQAVGVPVAKDTLLVDATAVHDALAVFVRIDAKTLAPAEARRVSTRAGLKALTTVTVADGAFAPVALASAEQKPPTGKTPPEGPAPAAVAYGLGIFTELGAAWRHVKVTVAPASAKDGAAVAGGLAAGEGAGPVLDGAGKLLGFLAGKTDVKADGGGPDRFLPAAQLADLVSRSSRSHRSWRPSGTSTSQPTAAATVEGSVFIVYAVAGERFGQDEKRR